MNYVTLTSGIPGISTVTNASIGGYIEILFEIGISVAAALAVLMIIIGGIQYMSSDAVGGKEEGKGRITSALWGLLLALISFLILNTINPQLVSTSLTIPQATDKNSASPSATVPDSSDLNNYVNTVPDYAVDPNNPQNNATLAPNNQTPANSIQPSPDGGDVLNPSYIAIDTDGTSRPPFSDPSYQNVTSLPGLNANTDYYIVVPSNSPYALGTSVLVTDNTTGKQVWAIVGDHGPAYGELSLAAAQAVGVWSPGMGNSANQHNISLTFYPK